MNQPVTLKEVNTDNLPLAVSLARKVFPYEIHSDGFWPELAYKMSIAENDPNFKYYIAFQNNEPVGISGHYSEREKNPVEIWLGWFGVVPEARRNGRGTLILLSTAQIIHGLGFKELNLYSGDREEERNAHKLYLKHGFDKVGSGKVDGLPVLYFKANLPLRD
jgi:GNAT superfamily N-acetyltransferase